MERLVHNFEIQLRSDPCINTSISRPARATPTAFEFLINFVKSHSQGQKVFQIPHRRYILGDQKYILII